MSTIKTDFEKAFKEKMSAPPESYGEIARWAAAWMADRLEHHFIQDCGPGCACERNVVAEEIRENTRGLQPDVS